MTDDVLSVPTAFADVATLAQGFMNRADGERLLLPLSGAIAEGHGIRFVVTLVDGTPAFAGAGRVAQVSDQGDAVAPAARFETLLDSLQFDERSQPVYDYIVAVRNAAYQQGGEAGQAQEQAAEVAADDAGEYADAGFDAQDDPEQTPVPGEGYAPETGEVYMQAEGYGDDAMQVPHAEFEEAPYEQPQSLTPDLIPTGMLTRPALGVHWAPSPPRRPTPRPSSGMFQYNGSGLPVPAGPPKPDLDPAYWVTRAPHPRDRAAQAAAAAAPAAAAGSYASEDGFEEAEPTYAQEALQDGGVEAAAAQDYDFDDAEAPEQAQGDARFGEEASGDEESFADVLSDEEPAVEEAAEVEVGVDDDDESI